MKQTVEEAAREYYERRKINLSKDLFRPRIIDVFKAGAEWQSKQSPWISVDEKLPENDDDYYIGLDAYMQPHGCDIVEFNPITKKFSDRYRTVNITHWTNIPKLNKEE